MGTLCLWERPQKDQNINEKSGLFYIQICLSTICVLKREFLVFANQSPFETNSIEIIHKWLNIIKKFWKFESLCIHKLEINKENKYNKSILMQHLFNACSLNYWSTRYPDPKSDIYNNNLRINLSNRIL